MATDYMAEKREQQKLDIELAQAKEMPRTARHLIWAVVCAIALIGTALIIARTVVELAKIHAGIK